MNETTCWICGASSQSSLCNSCGDRARATDEPVTDAVPAADVDTDTELVFPAAVPVSVLDRPKRRPMHWTWDKRRGLLAGVIAGGVAVLLVLGISFGWADATDRASELEHTVNDRDRALERAERKLGKSKKEQRQVTKSLAEAQAVNAYADALYRTSQASLQQATGQVNALQTQLAFSSIAVSQSQACLSGVLSTVDVQGQANRAAAVSQALAASC